MEHIHVDGDTGGQYAIQPFGILFRNNGMVFGAPPVEPGRVPFRNVKWALPSMVHSDQFLELTGFVESVDRRKQSVEMSIFDCCGRVASVKQSVETGFFKHFAVNFEVVLVVRIESVLIFNLDHQNIASMVDLQRGKLLAHLPQVVLVEVKVGWFFAANHQSGFILQPVRISAKFPFGTYIRTWAENDPQSLFSGYLDKFCDVVVPRKVVFPFLRFVQVPEYIGADGVDAHRFGSLHPGPPAFTWNPRIMHLCRDHLKWFSVQYKG